jgi:hypothetical protein
MDESDVELQFSMDDLGDIREAHAKTDKNESSGGN